MEKYLDVSGVTEARREYAARHECVQRLESHGALRWSALSCVDEADMARE